MGETDKAVEEIYGRALRRAKAALSALPVLTPWCLYVAVAVACTLYLNYRAALVPKWGTWYPEYEPYVLLQVRAFLSGHTAIVPHPQGATNDYNWGRGGMHQAWGLGVALLALPFHLVGRAFGAPGFPDDVRFLILYALTTVWLARALHRAAPDEPTALVGSCAAAGFVVTFPTFVGLVTSRFLIYEQTIATAALWSVGLLGGLLWLLADYTPRKLALVCFAAGFAMTVRPTHGAYGFTTLGIALLVARYRGAVQRDFAAGLAAFGGGTATFFIGNWLRFGGLFNSGYGNSVSGEFVNRLTRWGLPFAKIPMAQAAKEMFVMMFLLEPVPTQIMMGAPPPPMQKYAIGERWREYYAPTFDLLILAVWVGALVIVVSRLVRRKFWRGDPRGDAMVVMGTWGVVPLLVLFPFYSRIGQAVTRYATDMYPAMAAAALCVGTAIVDAVRKRAPRSVGSAHLAIAGGFALYLGTWNGWATHLSRPVDDKSILATITAIDSRSSGPPPTPDHFKCDEPRGPSPVHTHLDGWRGDCVFKSGMIFAMKHSTCVTFTFAPQSGHWSEADEQSLAAFRANADTDALVRCGPAAVDGESRRLTLCDPRKPSYLLDGMRLYAVASLDEKLEPLDRLKLMRIDPAPACP